MSELFFYEPLNFVWSAPHPRHDPNGHWNAMIAFNYKMKILVPRYDGDQWCIHCGDPNCVKRVPRCNSLDEAIRLANEHWLWHLRSHFKPVPLASDLVDCDATF